MIKEKIVLDWEELKIKIQKNREDGNKIVFTNGCFDIIHFGHVSYLENASKLGDILVVAVNSDSSVKRLKGDERPINHELDRASVLAALESVRYVTLFSDDTPLSLIEQISPDCLVKGGDWSPKQIVGSDFVLAAGGDVKSINFEDGHSTTNVIEKIRERS